MISNSSPLIFLSKINQLYLLKKLFGHLLIPISVKDEIILENKPDSIIISEAIQGGWIKVVDVKEKIPLGIKGGESSAINLAIERKDRLIVDDALAIKIAKSFGVETMRTTTIIFMAVKKKFITKKQAISLIDMLIESGYYISPNYYSAILKGLSS